MFADGIDGAGGGDEDVTPVVGVDGDRVGPVAGAVDEGVGASGEEEATDAAGGVLDVADDLAAVVDVLGHRGSRTGDVEARVAAVVPAMATSLRPRGSSECSTPPNDADEAAHA
jgi:hypothetical protein